MNTAPQNTMLPADMISSGLSLSQLLAIIRAHRVWIAVVTVVIATLVTVASLLMSKTYEATATLLVDFEVNDPVVGREFPSMLANSYLSTQLDFLQSSRVLGAVVDKVGLAKDPDWRSGFKGGGGDAGMREFIINKIRRSLSVSAAKESRLVSVTVSANDAALAARIANSIAQEYLSAHRERIIAPARDRAQQFTEQLEELRQKMDKAQRAITEFRQKSGLVDLEQRVDVEGDRYKELSSRLVLAELERREADLRLQQMGRMRASGSGADIAILDSRLVQDLKSRLSVSEARMAELSKTLGRNHPERIALSAEIESIRARLNAEMGVYAGSIQSQARAAAGAEAALRRDLEAQREKVLETRRLADEGAIYQREFDTAKKIYENTLELFDQIELGSQSRYSNVSQIGEAQQPPSHSKPKTTINAIVGLVGGFLLGVISALFLELLNRRVRCREDVERDMDMQVLAELGKPKGLFAL